MTDPAMSPERAEEWARRFHETYERLAPAHGYETREASAKPWEEVPERNRALMVATVGAVLHDLLAHIKVLTDELAQLRYERRLLGACRRHLDEIADPEGRYTADAIRTAGDLAQRIVDEIGHPVTDEPALGPEFRERIAELERDLEWAVAERDHALKQIKKPDYEKLVGAYLSGAEPVAEQRERMRPVVEAAQGWRRCRPLTGTGMPTPENALIAAVDAYDAKPDGNTPIESPAAPSVDGERAPAQPTTSEE